MWPEYLFFGMTHMLTRLMMLSTCLLSSFFKFCSAVSEKKSKISQPIRGQGRHLGFPIRKKNTNLVKDFEILFPVKFRWILLSGFRVEVEHVSANQRPGWPSWISNWPKRHKLGRGCWDLASHQVWLNSFLWFQRRSLECISQSEVRVAILDFRSAPPPPKYTW